MKYRVMKYGHKVGHEPLIYGEVVTARELRVKDADLKPYLRRGVLRVSREEAAPSDTKND